MSKSNDPFLENVKIIGKHLEKNEKWFPYPEKNIRKFENDANQWNKKFLHRITQFEAVMKEFEKKMKSLEK